MCFLFQGLEYLRWFGPRSRSLIARYRLGTWICLCKKDMEGNRICEWCGGIENGLHALNECNINGRGLQQIKNILSDLESEEFEAFVLEIRNLFYYLEKAWKIRSAIPLSKILSFLR
jgi:hypothetical protein